MFVTHVQSVGPFLRVFGQLDTERMNLVQTAINRVIEIINQIPHSKVPTVSELPVDTICLALFLGKLYRRARIIGHWGHDDVFVQFIDYGNECNVKLQEICLLNFQTPEVEILQGTQTLATPFILTGIYCNWTPHQINELNADLGGQIVTAVTDAKLSEFTFISIIWRNENLVNYLVHIKHIGTIITLEEQTSIFSTILSKSDRLPKKPSNLTANKSHSIKATSRGLMPVRQLHSALSPAPFNTVSIMQLQPGGKVVGDGYDCRNIAKKPTIAHTIPPPVPLQTALTAPIIQAPTVIRMPYKNKAISLNRRPDVTTLPPPPRPRTDPSLIASPPKRSVITFKSNTLMVGKFYDVYCCYVENGPCLFSVHLKVNTTELNEMMNDIENIPLSNLTERPSIGMACIAKFSEDNHLYRAVIMTIKPTACQVAYVDYGNTETVPFTDIYEIPPSLLDQKIFAIRFALSGYKDIEPLDEVLKNAFKDMVLHKDLKLKVMPLEGPPLVQYCELYDGSTNILEALKLYKNRKLSYSPPPPLCSNDIVVIRYVESPKKFFVQKVDSINAFDQMMDDLFLHCKTLPSALRKFEKGAACAVKFENAWYRAEILGTTGDRVHIRHVDFGNERNVDRTQLCSISERLVKFPIQATKCCLKGFENTESLSESATVQLEMLAENANNERRHFKSQIYKIENNGTYLVNLIDDVMRPELNLMKRLYKLSMPFNKYIGLEREEYPYQEISQPMKPSTDYISVPAIFNSTTLNNDDRHNNEINMRSSNSVKSDDSRENSGSFEQNQNYRGQNQYSPNSRSLKENDCRREENDQLNTSFKGRNNNLPPRFQKNLDDNRKCKENRNSSYDQKRNGSNSDGYKSSSPNPPQQLTQPIQCDDEWDTEPQTLKTRAAAPVAASTITTTREEYVPLNYSYPQSDIVIPSREEVLLCWWVSPHQFYTHNCISVSKFEILMRDIQLFYKNKTPTNRSIDIGSSVIARYQKDQVLYRATVLAHNESLRKYRVELVDFGNVATVSADDVWLLEKRFAQFPIMAHLCGFESVVSNFEHRQITNQVEKYLKPGLKLYCNYLKKENNMHFADIEVNGQSLRELLIGDGYLSVVGPNLTLEMLSGQQIRIKIVSIKDLLNFQIKIESCDLNLMSSYNDIKFVKSNPHLSTEFKNNYEGKYCIADVIDVSKEKILMLQPIIPLFINNISQKICNYPVVYRDFTVKIPFIESENIIYVHPVEIEAKLAELLDNMFNFYSASGNSLTEYTPGTLCAALSSDGNWYRAKIVYYDSSNFSVEVYYIDYGNIEVIENKDNIRVLEEQFYESSALAIRIVLPIKANNPGDQATIDTIKSLTHGFELTLCIIENYKNTWIADIQSNGYSLIYVLKDSYSMANGMDIEHAKNLIDNDATLEMPQTPDISTKLSTFESAPIVNNSITPSADVVHSDSGIVSEKSDDIPEITSDMIPAYLSHCDNPGRFFLHLTSTYPELQQLQDNIQIVAGSLPALMTSVTGALCIALYTVDETWYRAKIIDSEIMAVQFIDYGNTDVITDSSYVKEMNEAFANIPPFAIPCALPISPRKTTDWVDEANIIFNEAYDKTVYFSYVTQNPKKNYVNLKIDGLSVADKLISDGLARKLEVLKSGENGFVSHINSLSDFYIQMESYADGLELIAGHLADFESFDVLKDNSVGNVCAAVFPDDSCWYRAKILSHTAEGTEVLFIDYGNTAITTELREISAEIANLPFLSKKCSLRMPDYILGWSDEAEAKFHELSAMGETVFVVELIEPSDHAIIDLYIGERNILEDLEPLCDKRPNIEMDLNSSMGKDDFAMHEHISEPKLEDVAITHVNSPKDFYIQLLSEKDQLDQILDGLNNADFDYPLVRPEVGTICTGLFVDDGGYYRAKVLSKEDDGGSKVIFIDYGNTSVSYEFYPLPIGWNTKPPLSYKCSLDSNGPLDLESQAVTDHFTRIATEDVNRVFKIDVINRAVTPWVVSLQYDNLHVYEELEKLMAENSQSNDDKCTIESSANQIMDEVMQKKFTDTEVKWEKILISYVTAATDFYIHRLSEKDKLDHILETLNSGEVTDALINPEVGMTCNALFNDDGAFYRAEILSVDQTDGYEVLFIDYGNVALATELYALPKGLNTIPPLAYQCSLETNGQLDITDSSINDDYLQMVTEYQNEGGEFDAAFINSEIKPWTVKVRYNGVDLYETLKERHPEAVQHDADQKIVQRIIDPLEEVAISYVNSPGDFYIHRICEKDELDEILNTLNSEEVGEVIEQPNLGSVCNALFSDDGAFYRAEILSRSENGGYEVLFIDYGNTAVSNELYTLPEKMSSIPGLAYHCSLEPKDDLDLTSDDTIEDFNRITNEFQNDGHIFTIKVLNDSSKPLIVSLNCNGNNIVNMLRKIDSSQDEVNSKEIVEKIIENSVDSFVSAEQAVSQIVSDIINESIGDKGHSTEVLKTTADQNAVSEIVSDIISKSLEERAENVSQKITNEIIENTLERVNLADEIVSEIIDQSLDCDLDFSKKIVNNIIDKTLEDHSSSEKLASGIVSDIIDESLQGRPNFENSSNAENDADETVKFVKNVVETVVELSLGPENKNQDTVELQNSKNTKDILSNIKTNNDTSLDVIITQVYHSTDFYTRLYSVEEDVKQIEELLKNASDFPQLSDPQIGNICAVCHPDENVYHRAKILSVNPDKKHEVELIDSGVRLYTDDLRSVDENLRNRSPLARHCKLAVLVESEQFIKFVESNPKKHFEMKIIDDNENTSTVILLSNGVNIDAELEVMRTVDQVIDASLRELLKDAMVSHINSPNDFYIQLACDMKNLESITEALYDAVNFAKVSKPEVGLLCAAVFPDDGAFYRAQILNICDEKSYEVRFVDFGNDSLTEDIRILPDDLKNKEFLAKQCALENLCEIDLWSDQATDLFRSFITSHFGETFQVEIVSSSQTPWIVKVFHEFKNLYAELKAVIAEEHSQDSSDVWMEARDSTGAVICTDIVEELIDDLPLTNGKQSANDSKSPADSSELSRCDLNSSDISNAVTCEELAQQLWDGLKKLGITNSMGNRASSTSNLCDNKLMKSANSVTTLLSAKTDPTRSKSVECVIDNN